MLAAAWREAAQRWPGWVGAGRNRGAQWVWRDGDLRSIGPTAFFAVRDFDLAAVPARAEVSVVGDEEYVLYLNGEWIGGGAWSPGASADRYEVTAFLRPGRNRWVAELRSATGSGGFRLELADEAGLTLVATDGEWRRLDGAWHGLFREIPLLPELPKVRVLGRSPLGRWGSPGSGPPRPALAMRDLSRVRRAAAVRFPGEGAAERPIEGRRRGPNLGPLVEFDFGAEVSGYLQLSYRDIEGDRGPRTALLRFGDQPAPETPWLADEVVVPIPAAGNRVEALPRTFRYVAVAGLPGVFAAEVLEAGVAEEAAVARTCCSVFGLGKSSLRAPMQHEIWRELERFPGVVRGQLP